MFIVIEGMDGSGKSTITKLLSKRLNAVSYSTPPKKYSRIRGDIDNYGDQYSKFFYYLSGNYFAAVEIKEMLKRGEVIVCDRYYYTTLSAYNELLNSLIPKVFTSEKSLIDTFYQPDFAFFLTLSEDERAKRIDQRQQASKDDLDSLISSVSLKQINKYSEMNLIFIDTNGLDQNEVVDSIMKKINYSHIDS